MFQQGCVIGRQRFHNAILATPTPQSISHAIQSIPCVLARLLVTSLFLVASFLFLLSVVSPAYAVTSAEKRAEADAIMEQLDLLQDDVNAATENYNAAIDAHEDAISSLEEAQARISAADALIAATQSKLATRASYMYRNGSISFIEWLLGTASFEEFVSTWDLLTNINQQDAELVQRSKDARAEADAARLEYAKQETIAADQLALAARNKMTLDDSAAAMQAQIDSLSAEAAELLAQEEAAAAEEEERRRRESAPVEYVGTGKLAHPCPDYSYISSTFGWRDWDSSYHKGVDFAAPSWTDIYAAMSGTVIVAGWNGSAGYWVIISHGSGVVTKYMHMVCEPYVSAGDHVNAGDNIGAVGSTGYSSGSHLHFQVEVDGIAVDPLDYL